MTALKRARAPSRHYLSHTELLLPAVFVLSRQDRLGFVTRWQEALQALSPLRYLGC